MEFTPSTFVGVGGWAYFPSKNENRLVHCAKIYDFVEVNSSFYKLPHEGLARKWRAIVPDAFQFSLRANRKLTHESHLEPTEENYREYEKNLIICKALRAFVLHFQFPPSFEVTRSVVQNWCDFFASANKESGLRFAMEIRNPDGDKEEIRSFQEDYDIIPVSDPFRNEIEVSKDSKIQYSRIFGFGEHTRWNFSTSELLELKLKLARTSASKRYLTFHNLSMYEDGARMKKMISPEGADLEPSLVGTEALRQAIIAEGIHFPILSQDLSSKLTWRTLGTFDGRHVRINEILDDLGRNVQLKSLEETLSLCSSLFSQRRLA